MSTDIIAVIDLDVFAKPIMKLRFRQIQELAISKGFGWINSGRMVLRTYTDRGSYNMAFDFKKKRMLYVTSYATHNYRELVKLLGAL